MRQNVETNKARFITSGQYHDYYACPECDEEMPVTPGQDQSECPNPQCAKKWRLNYDASFDDGSWHDKTTITPIQ